MPNDSSNVYVNPPVDDPNGNVESCTIISLLPIRWKRTIVSGGAGPTGQDVAGVRRLIHIELGLLALMPLMAVLMARGIGR